MYVTVTLYEQHCILLFTSTILCLLKICKLLLKFCFTASGLVIAFYRLHRYVPSVL